jgi:hypothetical protein
VQRCVASGNPFIAFGARVGAFARFLGVFAKSLGVFGQLFRVSAQRFGAFATRFREARQLSVVFGLRYYPPAYRPRFTCCRSPSRIQPTERSVWGFTRNAGAPPGSK